MVEKNYVTRSEVRNMLRSSDKAVVRAVCRLAMNQVEIERARHESLYRNNRGFCKQDAGRFTRMAEKVWAGGSMTQEEVLFARPRMMKYAAQLAGYATRLLRDRSMMFS